MLQQINKRLERNMSLITPASVILGIIFSVYLKDHAFLVPWLFAFMTFEGSLSMNIKSIKGAVSHPLPIIFALGFLHIIKPLWAWSVIYIGKAVEI